MMMLQLLRMAMNPEHLDNEAHVTDAVKSQAVNRIATKVQMISRDVTDALRHLDPKSLTPNGFSKLPKRTQYIYNTLSPEHDYSALVKGLHALQYSCGVVRDVFGRPTPPESSEPDDPKRAEQIRQSRKLAARIQARFPSEPVPVEQLALVERNCERLCAFTEALAAQPGTETRMVEDAQRFRRAFDVAKRSGLFQELPLRLRDQPARY